MTLPTPKEVLFDPEKFSEHFLYILDKDKSLVHFRWNRAQRHFSSHRTGRDLILKARQLGFSTLVQGEMFRREVTSTRAAMTLAHDDETTQKLRRMADRFWENCKFGNVQPLRKYSNATLTTYPEFDSEATIATAGNKEAGRGGTYTDFHGSEVAFWKDAEKLVAGAMQGGSPDVVLESTPNGTQGWFYEKCMEALDGNSIWTLHFYPWWWDDGYRTALEPGEEIQYTDEESVLVKKHNLQPDQIKWRRNKRRELGRLFIQEYPEDPRTCFLTSGNSYFGDLSIPLEDVFTAPLDATYQEGHQYRAGLDFGKQQDYLSLSVFDFTDRVQVDLLHINQLAWGEMRRRCHEKYNQWQLPYIVAESNSMGDTNIEAMIEMGMSIFPFNTTNESKALVCQNLHEGLDTGFKLQPYEVQRHEFQTFVSTQLPSGLWRYAAEGTGHDDTVISGALAYDAPNHNPWLFM